jgi:phenylalanyl-tRNA synthetase beta chain
MKISLSWLKRHVDFSWSASELAERLTMRGFESEVATDFSTLDHVVVGQVISCQKHPDADKLSLCKVSDGSTEFDVICGAPNVATNQKIVFAKVGAILPGNFKIGKAKIRGIESHGMICSERELGISEEHEGILILDDKAKVGTSIEKVLGPLFNAIEVEITPDKGFALSHRGIAREIAAMTNQSLKIPFSLHKPKQNASLEKISIDLDSKGGCTRYIGAVMEDVKVGPSPDWLKNYLKSVGQKKYQ